LNHLRCLGARRVNARTRLQVSQGGLRRYAFDLGPISPPGTAATVAAAVLGITPFALSGRGIAERLAWSLTLLLGSTCAGLGDRSGPALPALAVPGFAGRSGRISRWGR
jgi:hypothetical protein